MISNRKVITQVDQVLATTYVYGGCQCIRMRCHFTRTPYESIFPVLEGMLFNSEAAFEG